MRDHCCTRTLRERELLLNRAFEFYHGRQNYFFFDLQNAFKIRVLLEA